MYQEDFLQGIVKHLNTGLFNGQKWIFQQEPAPAYKAKKLRSAAETRYCSYQPSGLAFGETRPHHLEYKMWAVLEDKAWAKSITTWTD
jgi:hypothetical protein